MHCFNRHRVQEHPNSVDADYSIVYNSGEGLDGEDGTHSTECMRDYDWHKKCMLKKNKRKRESSEVQLVFGREAEAALAVETAEYSFGRENQVV